MQGPAGKCAYIQMVGLFSCQPISYARPVAAAIRTPQKPRVPKIDRLFEPYEQRIRTQQKLGLVAAAERLSEPYERRNNAG
jgi:hypothetical protein